MSLNSAGFQEQHFLCELQFQTERVAAVFALVPWIQGQAIVGDGLVGVQHRRAIDFGHDLLVLFKLVVSSLFGCCF